METRNLGLSVAIAAALILTGCSHTVNDGSERSAGNCERAPAIEPKVGVRCELIGENGNDDVYGSAASALQGNIEALDRTTVYQNGDCLITEVQPTYFACKPADLDLLIVPLVGVTTDTGKILPGKSVYIHRLQ